MREDDMGFYLDLTNSIDRLIIDLNGTDVK